VAIESLTQAPRAVAGNAVLGVASLACQGYADIELPYGQTSPLSLFLVTIAETGDRKSSADRLAMQGVKTEEARLAAGHNADQAHHRSKLEIWNNDRQKIIKQADSAEQRQAALLALGPEPEPPPRAVLTVQEPTLQGLYRSLKEGQPSQGLFSDEGAAFMGGYAMKEENRQETAAGLSKLWDGDDIRNPRAGKGYDLVGKRLCLHLMLQPIIAGQLLAIVPLLAPGLVFQG
jgi:Protein of unknown function (DUF3987)